MELEIVGSLPHLMMLALFALGLPTGPYPILVLPAAVASAKSALASMLRAVIDPGAAPFCPPPDSNRETSMGNV